MFLPPVVLAIRSRYVLEAAVYTFTMFFSTVCSGTCVFTEFLSLVVDEGLHFHHVLHGFGDVCTFIIRGCLLTVSSMAVLPNLFISWCAENMAVSIRHIEQGWS